MRGWLVIGGIFLTMFLVLFTVAWFEKPLCQYCNNDGDPCPRCHTKDVGCQSPQVP